jgi:hypothetical protein
MEVIAPFSSSAAVAAWSHVECISLAEGSPAPGSNSPAPERRPKLDSAE